MQDGKELFSAEEIQSPFEVIKETDGEGREWWNSRKLAREVLKEYIIKGFVMDDERLKVKNSFGATTLMSCLNASGKSVLRSVAIIRKSPISMRNVAAIMTPRRRRQNFPF